MALPPPSLDNTVVVTGASAGIGTELARELAEELRLAHGVNGDVEACDLTDAEARRDLVARLQAGEREVVGVCNNAGFGTVATLVQSDIEREQQVVRLNVEAVHHLTGAFLPRMVEQGAGAVLNVASTAAFQPLPGFATYAASKAFVQSFSEAVHSEMTGTGVSVTSLCPGFTRTEFEQAAGAEDAASKLPGFTWMESEDVARQAVEGMVAGKRTVVPGTL